MDKRLNRLKQAALIASAVVLLLQACSPRGFTTSREAADAWTVGVVSGDTELVSEALGREVSQAEVVQWREDFLGLNQTYKQVVPGLGVSMDEKETTTYVLESITVDGRTIYSDDAPLSAVFLVVARDRGWHVVLAEPLGVPGE